jgi:hypothetical protein
VTPISKYGRLKGGKEAPEENQDKKWKVRTVN